MAPAKAVKFKMKPKQTEVKAADPCCDCGVRKYECKRCKCAKNQTPCTNCSSEKCANRTNTSEGGGIDGDHGKKEKRRNFEPRDIVEAGGGGNCFFHCISLAVLNNSVK